LGRAYRLTLIVIPAIFGLIKGLRLPSGDQGKPPSPVKTRSIVSKASVPEPAE
jgi:Cu(I)/Ag(I) efflux system membrane protein CusA/SilA